MNLYHVECPELGCMDVFAHDRDKVVELMSIYLALNHAKTVMYWVNEATDPMLLNSKERSMLLQAAGLDVQGFGIRKEDRWEIIPFWEYPFPHK